MTRAEHLAWAKTRALEYVDVGELPQGFASLMSDLRKHPETKGHPAIALGGTLALLGDLNSEPEMRRFIREIQ